MANGETTVDTTTVDNVAQTEQEALGDVLKGQTEGGAARAGGALGPGADVPTVLKEQPAVRQLVEEAIGTATGQQVPGPEVPLQEPSAVTTAAPAAAQMDERVAQVDEAEQFFAAVPPAEMPPEFQQPSGLKLEASGLTSEQEALFNEAQAIAGESVDSTVSSIEAQAEGDIRKLQAQQRVARGSARVQLARMGALNTTTAGVQYMQDLTNTHNSQISDTRAKGERLIAEARIAARSADLDLMQSKLQQIDANRKEIQDEQSRYLDNVRKMQEISQFNRNTATETINAMVTSGIGADQIPDGYLEQLDKQSGFPPGVTESMFNVAQREQEELGAQAEIEQLDSLMDLLSKVPQGMPIQIGNSTYLGQKNTSEVIGTEIDKATGDVVSIIQNSLTGEVSTQTSRGILTPNVSYSKQEIDGKWWYVPDDPSQGGAVPIVGESSGAGANQGGMDSAAIRQQFPAGESFSFDKNGKPRSWCLEFIRELSEDGSLPPPGTMDTIQSKRDFADESIGFGEGQVPPQAGDIILTNEDSKWGHIAIISEIRTNPDTGQKVAILTESNYTPNTVTYHREMVLDGTNMETEQGRGGKIMGFHRADLKPQYAANPSDVTPGQLGPGVGPTGLSPQELIEIETDLAKDFNARPILKDFNDRAASFGTIISSVNIPENQEALQAIQRGETVSSIEGTAAGDIAMVFAFMKVLDPGSTVREGEFDKAASAAGVPGRFRTAIQRLGKGDSLNPEQRADFLNTVVRQFEQSKISAQPTLDEFTSRAERSGVNPATFIPETTLQFSGIKEAPTAEAPAVTTQTIKSQFPQFSSFIDRFEAQGLSPNEIQSILNNL